jgi:hypothetical protein
MSGGGRTSLLPPAATSVFLEEPSLSVKDSLKTHNDLVGHKNTPATQLPLLLEYLSYLELRRLPPLLEPYLQWRRSVQLAPESLLKAAATQMNWKTKQQFELTIIYVELLHSEQESIPTFKDFLAALISPEPAPVGPPPAATGLAAAAPPVPVERLPEGMTVQDILFAPDGPSTQSIQGLLALTAPVPDFGLGDLLFPNTVLFADGRVAHIEVVNAEPKPYLNLAVRDATGNQLSTSDIEPRQQFVAEVAQIDVGNVRYYFRLYPAPPPVPAVGSSLQQAGTQAPVATGPVQLPLLPPETP